MIKKIGTFALLVLSLSAFAQQSEPATETQPAATQPTRRYARPDIPGIFTIEIGVNNALDKPKGFDLGFWGSRSLNIYYQYELRILKSRLSFVPGIGFSLERFKFTNNNTIRFQDDDSLKMTTPAELGLSIRKSKLITNYIDVPLELKYMTRPNDPNRSFKVSVGFRIGWMYDAFTKIKYREDGETKKLKENQNYNLTRFRYGVYFKVGAGNIALFANYNLTPLFQTGKGLGQRGPTISPDFNTFTIGLSLASF